MAAGRAGDLGVRETDEGTPSVGGATSGVVERADALARGRAGPAAGAADPVEAVCCAKRWVSQVNTYANAKQRLTGLALEREATAGPAPRSTDDLAGAEADKLGADAVGRTACAARGARESFEAGAAATAGREGVLISGALDVAPDWVGPAAAAAAAARGRLAIRPVPVGGCKVDVTVRRVDGAARSFAAAERDLSRPIRWVGWVEACPGLSAASETFATPWLLEVEELKVDWVERRRGALEAVVLGCLVGACAV